MRLIEKRKKDSPGSVRVIPLLLALLALLTLSGLSHTAGAEEKSEASYTSLAELEHQRIGVLTGTVQAIQAQERLPEANFLYYSSEADTLAALRAGKIDAFAAAEAVARYMMPENPDISILPEKLAGGMKVCSIFPKTEKGKALCDEFSTFIREIRDNGIYDEISRNYFETASEHRILPETEGLPAPNGTLRVAMNSTMAPFAYIQDGRTAGIDVETVARFCRERGYGLEIVPMEFTGILPAVTTGKCDLACGGIAYTDERAESVYFAEPTSALDPTTIGEVLSVIRNMSRQGMTMVIVTHEMKFTRDVSNRVFYLDEGIVYEEGTPEQIFTTPVKEKTRQFIRHLQVLTIRIDGLRFDYGNALTQIETFGQQHMIERVLVRRMITLTEELGVEILQRRFREQTRAEILFELEESTGIIHAKITFQGAGFDPLTDGDPTSVALVRAAAPDITAKQEEDTVILSATLAAGS